MGVKEEVVQKKRLDILLYYFFSFQKKKKKLKAIPTLYCCNTIDPPYPVLL
jgi:hypothetical protein